jgi:hypothetical protein
MRDAVVPPTEGADQSRTTDGPQGLGREWSEAVDFLSCASPKRVVAPTDPVEIVIGDGMMARGLRAHSRHNLCSDRVLGVGRTSGKDLLYDFVKCEVRSVVASFEPPYRCLDFFSASHIHLTSTLALMSR